MDRTSVSTVRMRQGEGVSGNHQWNAHCVMLLSTSTHKHSLLLLESFSSENVHNVQAAQLSVPVVTDHCYSEVPLTPRKEALKRKQTFVQQMPVASREKVKILM